MCNLILLLKSFLRLTILKECCFKNCVYLDYMDYWNYIRIFICGFSIFSNGFFFVFFFLACQCVFI